MNLKIICIILTIILLIVLFSILFYHFTHKQTVQHGGAGNDKSTFAVVYKSITNGKIDANDQTNELSVDLLTTFINKLSYVSFDRKLIPYLTIVYIDMQNILMDKFNNVHPTEELKNCKQQYLLPFVNSVVLDVDKKNNQILVEWNEDWI